jgi:RNA polymerase sigma factor (sigma-70 family)
LTEKAKFVLGSKLSTLLIGIADNIIKEGFRKPTLQSLDDNAFSIFSEFEDTQISKIELEELFVILENNLKKVGEKCQNIIDLFYFKALSHKEIMAQLNFSSPEVSRVTLNRCVDSLRKLSF